MPDPVPPKSVTPPGSLPGTPPAPAPAPAPATPDATQRLAVAETENQTLRGSLEEYKRANEELLMRLAAPQQQQQPPMQPPKPEDIKTKWWTDPQAAFQEQAQPLMQSMMNTSYHLMRTQMEQRYSQEFKLWGKEIDDMLKELHPNYLMNPKTWDITIERVRGRHVKDYATNPNLVAAYSEPPSPGAPPAPPDPAGQLSAEELKMAARFKLTPQQYAARKATIKVVS